MRLIIALPLYLLLDGYVNARLKRAAGEFVQRGIVVDRERFALSLQRVQALAASGASELVLLSAAIGSAYLSHAGDPSAT